MRVSFTYKGAKHVIVVSVLIFLTPTFLGSGPLGTQYTLLQLVIKSQALIFQFWGKSTLLQHEYQYEIIIFFVMECLLDSRVIFWGFF